MTIEGVGARHSICGRKERYQAGAAVPHNRQPKTHTHTHSRLFLQTGAATSNYRKKKKQTIFQTNK